MNPVRTIVPTLILAAFALPLGASEFSYREEALRRLGILERKFVELAEGIPADKYTWRMTDDMRTVSELFLHVSASNYGMVRVFGVMPPEGFNFRGFERSTTDKAKVVESLKASFAHARHAMETLGEGSADKPVRTFGRPSSTRAAAWGMLEHLSEHLGLAIAYARLNGFVPPWTSERMR